MRALALLAAAITAPVLVGGSLGAWAQVTPDAPAGRPAAIVDLATEEGTRLVQG